MGALPPHPVELDFPIKISSSRRKMVLGSSASGRKKKMATIFRFVDSARSNAGHAQKNISGDRQSGNYPTHLKGVAFSLDMSILSLASFLWDIGTQNSPRCDAAKRGVPSEAILFAILIFIEK